MNFAKSRANGNIGNVPGPNRTLVELLNAAVLHPQCGDCLLSLDQATAKLAINIISSIQDFHAKSLVAGSDQNIISDGCLRDVSL